MPIYLTLRTADAMRLQDLPGGDGARVAFLTSLGVQMVRRLGVGLGGSPCQPGSRDRQVSPLTQLSSLVPLVVLTTRDSWVRHGPSSWCQALRGISYANAGILTVSGPSPDGHNPSSQPPPPRAPTPHLPHCSERFQLDDVCLVCSATQRRS